jgi:hypothetical protein
MEHNPKGDVEGISNGPGTLYLLCWKNPNTEQVPSAMEIKLTGGIHIQMAGYLPRSIQDDNGDQPQWKIPTKVLLNPSNITTQITT